MLRNIVNGIVTKDEVNVHQYESVVKVLVRMIGQPVFCFSFKRKDKAKTLVNSCAVRVGPVIPCSIQHWRSISGEDDEIRADSIPAIPL